MEAERAEQPEELKLFSEDKRWGHILRMEARVKELESTLRTLAGTFHSIVHSGPERYCDEAICKTANRVLSQTLATWDDTWGWQDQQIAGVDKPYNLFQPDPYEEAISYATYEVEEKKRNHAPAWEKVIELAKSIRPGEEGRVLIQSEKKGKKKTRGGIYNYVWRLLRIYGLSAYVNAKVREEEGGIAVTLFRTDGRKHEF